MDSREGGNLVKDCLVRGHTTEMPVSVSLTLLLTSQDIETSWDMLACSRKQDANTPVTARQRQRQEKEEEEEGETG